jgi:acyl-CoA synthetase (AMP-forming)/AMP-acid ligase II
VHDFHRWADARPDRIALTMGDSGEQHTAGALARRSREIAQWMAGQGLAAGDTVAVLMENRVEILELVLAARLAGLYVVVISTHLTAPEVAYILGDSGASQVFASAATAAQLQDAPVQRRHSVDPVDAADPAAGLASLAEALSAWRAQNPEPIDLSSRPLGRDLLYSSGTTGRPKGIRKALPAPVYREQPDPEFLSWQRNMGFDADTVYLSPAPLYHAAPLRYCVRTLDGGGSVVITARFDAQQSLALIERYRITHSQWVPTMLGRLLQLPEEVRHGYDLSSHRCAIHAAAPCPVAVKQALLDWWGDILLEYYAGSEGCGITLINSAEWRQRPGSVGRASHGRLHIVGEDGRELLPGEIGRVFFSGVAPFAYLNDPAKTREAIDERGWATYGDLGHVDEEGYLFLSDRRADLILSGGVNLYPQEIENALATHPAVREVAVVGVPEPDFGEQPMAVVVLRQGHSPSAETARAIVAEAGAGLSRLKRPQRLQFVDELPRLPTGKLLRRVLKDRLRDQPLAGFSLR